MATLFDMTPFTNIQRILTVKEKTFEIRPLKASDYHKGVCPLLAQLTVVGEVSEEAFTKRFEEMRSNTGVYYTIVIEDLASSEVIAVGSIVIELKFLRSCSKCGHIEDIVVDSRYRGLCLGEKLINTLTEIGKQVGCYKIILDCSEKNVPFYEKCNFARKEVQMAMYIPPQSKL